MDTTNLKQKEVMLTEESVVSHNTSTPLHSGYSSNFLEEEEE